MRVLKFKHGAQMRLQSTDITCLTCIFGQALGAESSQNSWDNQYMIYQYQILINLKFTSCKHLSHCFSSLVLAVDRIHMSMPFPCGEVKTCPLLPQ